jgi:hypothetical protein
MMTSSIAGIDLHQDTYTIGVVDANGVELAHGVFGCECRRLSRRHRAADRSRR